MKAFVANHKIENEEYENGLKEVEIERPKATGKDILVEVKAVATNPVDTKVLAGYLGLPATDEKGLIVGWDASGIIVEVGEEVKNFKVGEEVYFAGALLRNGCFAEYVLADERIVALKPKNLSFAEAAAAPLTTLTAWEAMIRLLQIQIPKNNEERETNSKKTILIIAGAGGVGSIAIQIAKKLLHLNVIATASRDDSIKWCKEHGADHIINHYHPLLPQIKELGMRGVDYIFSCTDITSKNFDEFIDAALPFARIAFITSSADNVNLGKLMLKSLSISGELMFTRPIFGDDIEYQHEILTNAAKLFDESILKSTKNYEYSFDLSHLISALKLQHSGKAIGKIVLVKH